MPADPPPRPLWYLAPGGIPLPAGSKRLPADVRWQTREGDREWIPVGTEPEVKGPPR